MTRCQVVTWHGIPTGVRAVRDGEQAVVHLPARFQAAVDNAAMKTGQTDEAAYLAGWQYEEVPEREGTPAEVAQAVAAELDARYAGAALTRLSREVVARLNGAETAAESNEESPS